MKHSKLAIAALIISCIGVTISITRFIMFLLTKKSEETDRILEPDYVDPEEFDFEAGEIYNQDEEEADNE